MSVGAEEFRRALSHWATGVTIVTSRTGETIHGMTVSAFSSVSLDPPLVLICADKNSNTLGVIAAGGVFAVHILAAGQEELSNLFASKKDEEHRFDEIAWRPGKTGAPLIPGALVIVECSVTARHDAGDHVIFVGRVEATEIGESDPLLHFRGVYRSLGD